MIPDAAVEAAAKVVAEQEGFGWLCKPAAIHFKLARLVLEAAAPHLRAQGLEEAAASIDADGSISKWLRARARACRAQP